MNEKNLIIVDMQKGLINDKNKYLIDRINLLLNNNKFDFVYYTRFKNHENCPHYSLLNWKEMMDNDSQNIVVKKKSNSCVLHKSSYGLDINDIELLKAKNVKEIYLCGTDVDACVLAIAYQLFDNGIKPFIIWDCVDTSSNNILKESLRPVYIRNFGKDCIVEHI